MAIEREVLEFIIVPSFEQRAAVAAAKERLENFLGHRFPGYKFRLGPFAPVGEEDRFCVLPIMNFVGDDGKTYMCEEPNRWLQQEIAYTCNEFDLKGKRSFAA